jgi:hypothetical protein
MSMRPASLGATAALLAALTAAPAVASILNGDFSDPTELAGFVATGTVVDEPTGDFAQLQTDDTGLRSLEQSFTVPAGGGILAFDFSFSADGGPPQLGQFSDSFFVSLLTATDLLDILVVDFLGVLPDPSDPLQSPAIDVGFVAGSPIAGFVPFANAGSATFGGSVSVVLPSAVLGVDATVFFELEGDTADGFTTRAAIDNVRISAASVSEPGTLALFALGALGAAALRRRRPPN